MQEREAVELKFDRRAEAERLLVWAGRATQICSATKLNQLAEQCAIFMDLEAFEQGDRTGEHLQAYTSEAASEYEEHRAYATTCDKGELVACCLPQRGHELPTP